MSDENEDVGIIEIVTTPANAQGQTLKQPVIWRCPNPECIEACGIIDHTDPLRLNQPNSRYFEFASDYPECPKCGCASSKRTLIHLLVRDKKGPITGEMGLRWKLACDPKRTHLATEDNGEAATGDSTCANCPGCLSSTAGKTVIDGQLLKMKR